MKKFRALTASILASAMVMSMTAGFATFAEGETEGNTTTASDNNIKKNVKDGKSVTYTITVNPNTDNDKKAKHVYEAYQIFKADMVEKTEKDENGKDVTKEEFTVQGWGDGITKPEDLITELKATKEFGVGDANIFAGINVATENDDSALKVATALTDTQGADEKAFFENDNEMMQLFAKIVNKYINDKAIAASEDASGNVLQEIEVSSAGYYLIKDTTDSPTVGDSEYKAGKTRYILTPTNTINPTAKADYPTIDKKIVEGTNRVSYNTAAIGDTIEYELTSTVPDMTGYNKYFYIVNDTMSKGITFDYKELTVTDDEGDKVTGASLSYVKPAEGTEDVEMGGVTVKIGDITLKNEKPNEWDTDKDKEFYVETTAEADGTTKIKVVFKNFKQYNKGDKITISYNGILNENANIGTTGNPNVVDLTFSNNPNYKYDGIPETPDEPNPKKPTDPDNPNKTEEEPTGKTPEIKVITYTTGIEITKVDASKKDKGLAGAEFKIVGENLNKVLIKDVDDYAEDENGTFYKLTDGTYTETEPEEGTTDKYASTTKYKTIKKIVAVTEGAEDKVMNLTVDKDGVLKIYGLNAGTYTITETKAPEGYILKSAPKTVIISAEKNDDGTMNITGDKCAWDYKATDVEDEGKGENGVLTFKITNHKGVVLPGTGAFGTKLIYALGTLFTGTGAAYMVSKKKSKKD